MEYLNSLSIPEILEINTQASKMADKEKKDIDRARRK